MRRVCVLFAILAVSLFAKPTVSVSILPQKYFVEQIAKDTLDINVMVGKGASPATYEPKPKQMSNLAKSGIYFAIGVPFENVWLKKFSSLYPKLPIIHTDDGIEKLQMKSHSHREENHAEHEGIPDPHIWLDPNLVKIQVASIAKALIKKYPKNRALYEKNLENFLKRLDLLDEEFKTLLKNKKGKKFLVYHPSWGYFAHRYGLVQEAIEIEGKEPKPRDLQNIINEAKEDKVHVIFVQPQFSQKSAKVIASQIDGKVIPIDQLSLHWENELKKSAKMLSTNLK